MKWLAFIFSWYILLLPALPCADSNECKPVDQTKVSATDCRGQQHQHEDEACSPFCACACCGQVFAPGFQLNKINLTKPATQKQQYFYTSVSLSSRHLGTIWQPPKV
ncbi:DUF6660 family protein [Ferruginibacter sp. SUN106]|uniref:DUF6660 family protein n=1 Tax=Ferruginibacter sp. SUN106 TaxID=2978348 RepID=UPI003D35EFFE